MQSFFEPCTAGTFSLIYDQLEQIESRGMRLKVRTPLDIISRWRVNLRSRMCSSLVTLLGRHTYNRR